MSYQQWLKEANYVHRGEDGDYIESLGQCGFAPCDHSKMVRDDRTGREYRYCMKLQMAVDDFDSCKYHSEENFMGLIGQMAKSFQEEDKAKERVNQSKTASEKKTTSFFPIFIMVCIDILVYVLIK